MELTEKVNISDKDFEIPFQVIKNNGKYVVLQDDHRGILVGRVHGDSDNLEDYTLHPLVGDPILLSYHDLQAMTLILGDVNVFGDMRRMPQTD